MNKTGSLAPKSTLLERQRWPRAPHVPSSEAIKVCPYGGHARVTWEQWDSGACSISLLFSQRGPMRTPALCSKAPATEKKSFKKNVRFPGPHWLRPLSSQFPETSDLSLPRARGPRAGQGAAQKAFPDVGTGLGKSFFPKSQWADVLVTLSS